MSASPKPIEDKPKRAPTLYFIVTLKLVKGSLLLLTALGISLLAGRDLGDMFDQFLVRVHLDPEQKFFLSIGDWLDKVTPANMRLAEMGSFLYGTLLLGGGLGLAFRAHWAVWLAIGESAFFIPIELYKLLEHHVADLSNHPHHGIFHHPKIGLLVVLAVNILIVCYLFINRNKIFKHHHLPP